MNNERLQGFLTAVASTSARNLAPSTVVADTIIRWMLSPDGPVAIADAAAWELITSECYAEQLDGHTWWRTHPAEIPMQLEQWERDTAASIEQALRYLSVRGVLMVHPSSPSLVRWPE